MDVVQSTQSFVGRLYTLTPGGNETLACAGPPQLRCQTCLHAATKSFHSLSEGRSPGTAKERGRMTSFTRLMRAGKENRHMSLRPRSIVLQHCGTMKYGQEYLAEVKLYVLEFSYKS